MTTQASLLFVRIIGTLLPRLLLPRLLSLLWIPLLLHVGVVSGSELTQLQWVDNPKQSVLRLHMTGKEIAYETTKLDQGRRLRIALKSTILGPKALDIGGNGPVSGVFPYVANNGKDVLIDILLQQIGGLKVARTASGFDIAIDEQPGLATTADEVAVQPSLVTTTVAAVKTQATDQAVATPQSVPSKSPVPAALNQLLSIRYITLPGNRIQIDLKMSRRPAKPGTFSTSKPARVAFDFFGTKNMLVKKSLKIGVGVVEGITTVETNDRTRVVLSLLRPADYQSQINDQGMTIVVASPLRISNTAAVKSTRHFSRPEQAGQNAIKNIDFRRSLEGSGKIIVNLSGPTVGIDIQEKGGEIVVDFLNTKLPKSLEKRLDVTDFATPVQTIDSFINRSSTRMIITPVGKYRYLAYQAGSVFTLHVTPKIAAKKTKKIDKFGYSGEKLSLNFQKISVRAALQVIADFTGLNFVTGDAVKGDLTLRLQNVPWDQALDIILQSKGLAMRKKGNVVWVAPAKEIAAKERAALEATKKVLELEPMASDLIQINYAKAKDIAKLLKSVRSVDTGISGSVLGGVTVGQVQTESNTLLSQRGSVTVDERTNSVLIQDTPLKIREIRKLITMLDRPVRQVLIETRIVEANDDFSKVLGTRLGFQSVTKNALLPGSSNSNLGQVITSGSSTGATSIANSVANNDNPIKFDTGNNGMNVNLPVTGINKDLAGSFAFSLFKAGAGFANLLSLELSALEAEGKGKIIASPRLITADQKKAHIEQGEERVFTVSVLGDGSVVTKKAVLGLTVTPQITPDDRIVIDVRITKDSFVANQTGSINTKQIITQVLMDNGETLVIGGIYSQDESSSLSKIPLLGDIPLIGKLFRKKIINKNRSELLIFLTPKIINPALNAI